MSTIKFIVISFLGFASYSLLAMEPETKETNAGVAITTLTSLPTEIQMHIVSYLIERGNSSLQKTIPNIAHLIQINKYFHELINHPQNIKWLIQVIANNTFGCNELDIARGLKNMRGVKAPEIQQWLKERKEEIILENELGIAVASGDLDFLEELIAKGVKVNCCLWYQKTTPLIIVTSSKLEDNSKKLLIIQKLLKAGADINCGDGALMTPLMFAVYTDETTVELLLKAGANVNKRDDHKKTALMYASGVQNHPIIMQKLLDFGAQVDLQDKDGYTALHYAVNRIYPKTVSQLLQAGADVSICDIKGLNVFDYAFKNTPFIHVTSAQEEIRSLLSEHEKTQHKKKRRKITKD